MGLNRSGEIAEAIRNIESDKALNIFPAAIQNEIFVKSKLRGKYQKDPIPTKENVWLPVIRSSCPSSFGNLFNLERLELVKGLLFDFLRLRSRQKFLFRDGGVAKDCFQLKEFF